MICILVIICAQRFKGAWWYKTCHNSNLNGLYPRGNHTSHGDGVNWVNWRGFYYSLQKTKVKIRPFCLIVLNTCH